MAKTSPFSERVVALLTPLGPVRSRAMFGGWGIFLDDIMFALIASDRLYFRIDDAVVERFAEAGSEPFVYEGKGKRVEMSYWLAPAGSLESPDALLPWAELGLAAARRNRKKNPKKKAKR